MERDHYSEFFMLEAAQGRTDLHVTIADHPLVRTALSTLRDKNTSVASFSAAIDSVTSFLLYEATRDLLEKCVEIETPLAPMIASAIDSKIVFIPVLRSGVGMLEQARKIFPGATTIFAGMARDEATAIPHWYYGLKQLEHLNSGAHTVFMVLDPMLATGGSADETITEIKKLYPKGTVKMVSVLAAPEGIKRVNEKHPDVAITVAAVDDHLNEKCYIVPGLGDAGDRQFGT